MLRTGVKTAHATISCTSTETAELVFMFSGRTIGSSFLTISLRCLCWLAVVSANPIAAAACILPPLYFAAIAISNSSLSVTFSPRSLPLTALSAS